MGRPSIFASQPFCLTGRKWWDDSFCIIWNVNHFDRNPQINEKTAKDHNKVFARNNPILRFTQILFVASPHVRWPTQDKTTSLLCSTMVPPTPVQTSKWFKVCKTIQTKLWWCNISFYKYHVCQRYPMFVHYRSNDVMDALQCSKPDKFMRIIAIHIGFSVSIWGAKLNFTFYSPTDWQWWTPVEDYCYPSQNADQKK